MLRQLACDSGCRTGHTLVCAEAAKLSEGRLPIYEECMRQGTGTIVTYITTWCLVDP